MIICCRTKCYDYIQDCEIMCSACEKSIILSAGNVPLSLSQLPPAFLSMLLQSFKTLTDTRLLLPISNPVKRSQIQGGGYVASPCCFSPFSLAWCAFVDEGGRERVTDALPGYRACGSGGSGSCSRAGTMGSSWQRKWGTLQSSSQKSTATLACNSRSFW